VALTCLRGLFSDRFVRRTIPGNFYAERNSERSLDLSAYLLALHLNHPKRGRHTAAHKAEVSELRGKAYLAKARLCGVDAEYDVVTSSFI